MISEFPDNSKVVTLAHYSNIDIADKKLLILKGILQQKHLHQQGARHTALLIMPANYVRDESSHEQRLEPIQRDIANAMMNITRNVFRKSLREKEIPYSMLTKKGITIQQDDPFLENTIFKGNLDQIEFQNVDIRFNRNRNEYLFTCNTASGEPRKFSLQNNEHQQGCKELSERLRQADRREFVLNFSSNNSTCYGVFGEHTELLNQAMPSSSRSDHAVLAQQPTRHSQMTTTQDTEETPLLEHQRTEELARAGIRARIRQAAKAISTLCCGR